MVESYKPYLAIIRVTLDEALCLRTFPSQLYEKINRPQVEVKENLELVNKPIIISRNDEEKVEIESSINSINVNVIIKKHVDVEKLIVNIYTKYLMHRANILNSSFNYTGIGVVTGSKYGKIYVQMFIGK